MLLVCHANDCYFLTAHFVLFSVRSYFMLSVWSVALTVFKGENVFMFKTRAKDEHNLSLLRNIGILYNFCLGFAVVIVL